MPVEYAPTLIAQNPQIPDATAKQIEANRAYANALLGIGKNDMNQPIGHWTQGISNMVKALVGGNEMYNANLQERMMKQQGAQMLPQRVEPGMPTGFASDEEGGAPVKASVSAPDPTDTLPPMPVEAQPAPAMPGAAPMPRPRPADAPDAFGARWPNTPWTTQTMPGQPDALPGDTMSFDGKPTEPGGIDAISQALAAPRGGAAKSPFGSAAPAGAPSGDYVDPRTVRTRPQISRQEIERLMANDFIDPEIKKAALQMYYEQHQPIEAVTTGGSVIIDPVTGVQRQKPELKWNERKTGVLTRQEGSTTVPDGRGGFIQKIIPRSDAGVEAPAAPSAAPGPSEGPSMPSLKRKPREGGALPFADETGGMEKSGLPPEILGGSSKPQDMMPPGMLGMAPPDFGTEKPVPTSEGTKVAQILPQEKADLKYLQNQDIQKAQQEHYNQKDVDDFTKDYDSLIQSGRAAARTRPMLDLAKGINEDPRMYSGIGGNLVRDVKQLQAVFGGDPEAASRMETFEKVISGQVIQDLKTQLQGLGQVRVAEIDLLAKAAASLNRTQPANRAVLELMTRVHDQIDDLAKIATDYRRGYRFDKDGNARLTSEVPSKAGLDATLNQYIKENPVLTADERKNYEFLFKNRDEKKYKELKKSLEGEPAASPSKETAPAKQTQPQRAVPKRPWEP